MNWIPSCLCIVKENAGLAQTHGNKTKDGDDGDGIVRENGESIEHTSRLT